MCEMSFADRLAFIAEGLPIILASAQGFWEASAKLRDHPRESDVLEGSADIWCLGLNGNAPLAKPIHVTSTGSIASSAEMTVDRNDRIAIVWPDRALGLDPPRIRLRMLSNTPTASRRTSKISHSSAVQLAPTLSIDGDKLTVVWEERSLGNNPIKVKSINLR